MAGSKEKVQVTLDAGFEGAVVPGGVRIEFSVKSHGDVYEPVRPLDISDTMLDGMKYAGTSPLASISVASSPAHDEIPLLFVPLPA